MLTILTNQILDLINRLDQEIADHEDALGLAPDVASTADCDNFARASDPGAGASG